MVRKPHFHFWGPRFVPWSRPKIPWAVWCGAKKKKKKNTTCLVAKNVTWGIFLVPLRMCILLLLYGMLYVCLLHLCDLMYHLKPVFSLWVFCLDGLCTDVIGALKSPLFIVLLFLTLSLLIVALYSYVLLRWVPKYLQMSHPLVGLTPLSLCITRLCLLLQSLF